ncbi:MAG: TspO/MBR family protein [Candidatus Paceibacterota bacterium]
MRSKLKVNYIIIPLVTIVVAVLGSWFTSQGINVGWYDTLIKPTFNPPNWLFGPAWTTIYILTTVSALIWWNQLKRDRWWLLLGVIFVYNAIVNASWSLAFFYLQEIGVGLWLATEIWASVLILMILLWSRSKTAALLLLPYLVWVSLATYLNYALWLLN